MSLFFFLTVVQAIVAAALVGIILMQKSEGGGLGLGGGGNPGGILGARGAGDFLTRTTAILAILFVVLSIVLAAVAVGQNTTREVNTTLDRVLAPAAQPEPELVPGDEGLDGEPPVDPVPAQENDPLADVAQ